MNPTRKKRSGGTSQRPASSSGQRQGSDYVVGLAYGLVVATFLNGLGAYTLERKIDGGDLIGILATVTLVAWVERRSQLRQAKGAHLHNLCMRRVDEARAAAEAVRAKAGTSGDLFDAVHGLPDAFRALANALDLLEKLLLRLDVEVPASQVKSLYLEVVLKWKNALTNEPLPKQTRARGLAATGEPYYIKFSARLDEIAVSLELWDEN